MLHDQIQIAIVFFYVNTLLSFSLSFFLVFILKEIFPSSISVNLQLFY